MSERVKITRAYANAYSNQQYYALPRPLPKGAWRCPYHVTRYPKELVNGDSVEGIAGLPITKLYAVCKTPRHEQQPAKVTRCLEVLTKYFAKV